MVKETMFFVVFSMFSTACFRFESLPVLNRSTFYPLICVGFSKGGLLSMAGRPPCAKLLVRSVASDSTARGPGVGGSGTVMNLSSKGPIWKTWVKVRRVKRIMIIWVKTMKKTNHHFWMIHVWSCIFVYESHFSKTTSAESHCFSQKYNDLIVHSQHTKACLYLAEGYRGSERGLMVEGKVPGDRRIPVIKLPHLTLHSSPSLRTMNSFVWGQFLNHEPMSKFLAWNF